jgi:hypothetical protein
VGIEANPSARQYNSIWTRLKQDHTVSVAAPRALHNRIWRAVQKEKWLDLGYKLELEPRTAVMTHASKNSVLTFWLEFKPLSVEDF